MLIEVVGLMGFINLTNVLIGSVDFQVKSDVRRLKGIPALVSMLDNPNREVSLYFSILFKMASDSRSVQVSFLLLESFEYSVFLCFF